MKRILLLGCCSAILGAPTAFGLTPTAPDVAHWNPPSLEGRIGTPVALFNGKNLDGWIGYEAKPAPGQPEVPLSQVWTVRDGIIHEIGLPLGYLRTLVDYDNFVLTIEERHLDRGNGGAFIALSGPDVVWPRCLEYQLLKGHEGDLFVDGLTSGPEAMQAFSLVTDPRLTRGRWAGRLGPDIEKPVGAWDTVQIVADHGYLTMLLNGTVVNAGRYTRGLSGKIALQAEKGVMEFRKVELSPIIRPPS